MIDLLHPLHPRLVHFPIALSLVGVAFLAWGILKRQESWTHYGQISLLLGWVGAIVAALSGLVDQARAADTPVVANAINQHITVGLALIVALGLALYWPLRNRRLFTDPRRRWGYLALLLLGAALVLLEGWLGGKLVYGLGVGVR